MDAKHSVFTEGLSNCCQMVTLGHNVDIMIFYYQAVEDQVVDVDNLHLMVQELSQRWSNVCGYIEVTSQRQELKKCGEMSVYCGL